MNTLEPSQTASTDKQAPRIRKSVMLSPSSHRQLDRMAKQLHVKNTEFVEAAIAYFHENGQSPFAAGDSLQAGIAQKIEQQAKEIRQHNENASHRLEAIMRDVERGLGRHLQEQQGGTLLYLERIERTILKYLTQVEEKVLLTMLQQIMQVSVETTLNRSLLELLLAKLHTRDFAVDEPKLSQYANSSEVQLTLLMIEKNEQMRDALKLAPVLVSEKPPVAAASQPHVPSLKKGISGARTVPTNSPLTQ